MTTFRSSKFQLIWAVWILILGASLAFFHTFQHVHSFSEYFAAFLRLDMPSSWCPTFLTLFGAASISARFLGDSAVRKVLVFAGRFAGLVLLPVGLYATYEFTAGEAARLDFMYLYAQTIHISEVLTGMFTILLLLRRGKAS
jgi:hypothetical protein